MKTRWVWALVTVLLSAGLIACGGGGGGDEDPAFRVVDLELTDPAPGVLDPSDHKAPDDTPFDLYRVRLTEPGRLTVRLESTGFDAYLLLCHAQALQEPNLELWEQYLIAEDDDSGGGTDAEISPDLPAGTYLIVVNSWDGGMGNYTVRATFVPQSSQIQLGTTYLQYRSYEGGATNRHQAWAQLSRDGAPVEATDVVEVRFLDSAGSPITPINSGFHPGQYLFLNCSVDPCTESGPLVDRGVWASFASLDAGIYGVEVDTAHGSTLSGRIEYPGQLVLPFVAGASLGAQWVGGDLALSWENPTSAAAWGEVDRLYLALFDGAGKDVLYVRLPPTASQVTVPASLLGQALALGDGTLAQWEVQTRAYDASSMNFARGYSARVGLPTRNTFAWALGPSRYLQYRTYENPALNRYQGWLPLTRDGLPVDEAEVWDIRLYDSQGLLVTPASSGFRAGQYLFLNCSATPCTSSGPVSDVGFWAALPALPAGTYELEVDTYDGQTLPASVPYPEQVALPVVAGASLQGQWQGADLHLSWVNPTGDANWAEVSRIYVVLFDGAGQDLLYVRLPTTAAGVTVPGALLTQAAALGIGALAQWEVQTRDYDANSMNYARGYSARVPLP